MARVVMAFSGICFPDALSRFRTSAVASKSFEDLYPLLRWPVALDPAALESKLIRDERGGDCYEQNSLLRHVLTALGFPVQGLLARVLWNLPPDAITLRSHMVLLITISDRRNTADLGFGTVTPTAPLLLEAATV